MQRKRSPTIPQATINFIHKRAELGVIPAEIHRELQQQSELYCPSRSKVYEFASQVPARDPSGPWSLANVPVSEAREARAVLTALGALAKASDGRITSLTNREADWIIRLRKAKPALSVIDAYHHARRYIGRWEGGATTEDLDLALAIGGLEGAIVGHYLRAAQGRLEPHELERQEEARRRELSRRQGRRLIRG